MEAQNLSSFVTLSKSELIALLQNTPYLTIKELCANPGGTIAEACNDEELWRAKWMNDFKNIYQLPPIIRSYRQIYQTTADQMINSLTQGSVAFQAGLSAHLTKNELPLDFVLGGPFMTRGGGVNVYVPVSNLWIFPITTFAAVNARRTHPAKPVIGDQMFVERSRGDPRTMSELIDAGQFEYISGPHAEMLVKQFLSQGYVNSTGANFNQKEFEWLQKEGIATLIR